jgi:hypothetical protein
MEKEEEVQGKLLNNSATHLLHCVSLDMIPDIVMNKPQRARTLVSGISFVSPCTAQGSIQLLKRLRCKGDLLLHVISQLGMCGAVPPLLHMSWRAT